jgi:acetolactate synthase-1/2/3 large subunit
MWITGAQYVLEILKQWNVRYCFTVPGAHIDPLIEATSSSGIQPVVCCHELSAGFMADGYSRAGQTLGVVAAIGGPGAGNLVSAVNTSRIERTPLLIITGDVPVSLQAFPAFQCAGDLGSKDDAVYAAVAKFSARILTVDALPTLLNRAIREAFSPPCGPAHLIIPYNLFKEMLEVPALLSETFIPEPSDNHYADSLVSTLCDLIAGDSQTALWVGEALNNDRSAASIAEIAEKFHLPVATTFGAKGLIPETHPLSLGNFGYAGSSKANTAFLSGPMDAIIGFDVEQNERNTLNWHPDLYAGKRILLVNFPPSFKPSGAVETHDHDPVTLVERLHQDLKTIPYSPNGRVSWLQSLTQTWPDAKQADAKRKDRIAPDILMKILRQELPAETLFYVDSGTHRIFAGTDWQALLPRTFFSASVTAPTGWAIAAGIGAKLVRKEPVVILTGDGCMQMHGIEIKTAVRYGIPVIVVLCNNGGMGNIHRRFAKISGDLAAHALITEVDWSTFVRSLGAVAMDAVDERSLQNAIRQCLRERGVTLINARIPIDPIIDREAHCRSAFA